MVLVGRNTKCSICGERISRGELVTMRHFIRNKLDPLAVFSDRAFHANCFDSHPLKQRALECEARRNQWSSEPRVCVVCGVEIKAGGMTTDLLVSEPTHPLFEFNYVSFHSEHLEEWEQLPQLREFVRQSVANGSFLGEPIVRVRA